MKKRSNFLICTVAALMALTLAAFAACTSSEKPPKGNEKPTGGNVIVVEDEKEVQYDADKLNVFSMEQIAKNGNTVTAKLKLGGEHVRLCGFKIVLNFDGEISVKSVKTSNTFNALAYNDNAAGRLVLLWAVTSNVEKAADVCEITFEIGKAASYAVSGSIESLGYFDTVNNKVRNTTAVFTPFNFNL